MMMALKGNDTFADAAVGDSITFNSDTGILTGTIADRKRDLGNGKSFFLVELDHELRGMFQGVPASTVRSVRCAKNSRTLEGGL
jgi:hypothetical protein